MDRQARMERILDHYENPRNHGRLDDYDAVMRGGNPGCGDVVTFFLRIDASAEAITDLRWEGMGCTISQAAASMISEKIKGESLRTVQAYGHEQLEQLFGRDVTASRLRCAALGLHTVKAALSTYLLEQEQAENNDVDDERESLGLEFESDVG